MHQHLGVAAPSRGIGRRPLADIGHPRHRLDEAAAREGTLHRPKLLRRVGHERHAALVAVREDARLLLLQVDARKGHHRAWVNAGVLEAGGDRRCDLGLRHALPRAQPHMDPLRDEAEADRLGRLLRRLHRNTERTGGCGIPIEQ